MSKTLAELLVDRLISWGVEINFGYPGDDCGRLRNGHYLGRPAHQDARRHDVFRFRFILLAEWAMRCPMRLRPPLLIRIGR
jgi:hypothetical protein